MGKWQHWILVTKVTFPTEPTVFTVWSYTGKVYQHLAWKPRAREKKLLKSFCWEVKGGCLRPVPWRWRGRGLDSSLTSLHTPRPTPCWPDFSAQTPLLYQQSLPQTSLSNWLLFLSFIFKRWWEEVMDVICLEGSRQLLELLSVKCLWWKEACGSGSCFWEVKWMVAFASCFDLYLRDEAVKSCIPNMFMKWLPFGHHSNSYSWWII